ncbi:MAG: tRNA (adenosine(37)-N6)-threonylcarbamoyltransferase complex ATPase subunit type 1 TsaE [Betaproteobacteria bacterium]
MSARVSLHSEVDSLELGSALATVLSSGQRLYLSGDLGAGKTTIVRGILFALGYDGRVKSPTFTLVELYKLSSIYLHHFDFYRFDAPEDWADAGFREAFNEHNVCVVEWPEKAGNSLPRADLHIYLEYAETGRLARIVAGTDAGLQCIQTLMNR